MSDAERPDAASDRRRARRLRGAAIFAGVALVEGGLFLLLGRSSDRPSPPVVDYPPFEVLLYNPPPPVSEEAPAPVVGGGAPAAPSRIHTPPPPPPEQERELPAPVAQAPEPALTVGVAPDATPTPGFGQGGEGTGAGSGVGSGSGPGGGSTGPRLVTGPTMAQVRANHPPGARSRYGRAELSCRIRLDTRLEACRVVSESPPGLGFGAAGLAVAVHFRFRPPTEGGRPVEGQKVTVGVDFGRPPR